MKRNLAILTFVFILIGFAGIILAENESNGNEGPVACTMDAKMCPDGSYVGRIAPDCEFAPCPHEGQIDCLSGPCPEGYSCEGEGGMCLPNEEGDENETDNEEQVVGSSCGTVTPGENNECCINKGYEGWDQEKFNCIGEKVRERDGNTVGSPRIMGAGQVYARERIRFDRMNTSECPEDCECSGSTVRCSFENGTRVMNVYAGRSGNVIVQVKNVNMSTNVTLYKEDGKVFANFSGNRTKEIHLPDEIKERMENNIRTRLYNESINLSEDGYYHIEAKKRSRLFWLIPVREHISAQVDAETGEAVKIRNPWWGFLARDLKEKNTED